MLKIKMVKVEIEKERFHEAPKEDLGLAQAMKLVAKIDPIKQLRILEDLHKLPIR